MVKQTTAVSHIIFPSGVTATFSSWPPYSEKRGGSGHGTRGKGLVPFTLFGKAIGRGVGGRCVCFCLGEGTATDFGDGEQTLRFCEKHSS